MDLSNEVTAFLANKNSEHTRRAYRTDLADFFGFNSKDICNLSVEDFIEYKNTLMNKHAAKTVNRKISSIKSFMKWCIGKGIINRNPSEGLDLPRNEVVNHTNALTRQEIKNMMGSVDRRGFRASSHTLILKILFNMGLRRSELVNIKLKDIFVDGDTKVLRILGKGQKLRHIPISSTMETALGDYLIFLSGLGISLNKDDYLIQSQKAYKNDKPMNPQAIYKLVNKYARRAGITKKVGAHSCRASAISHLLADGESVRNVADFAGHSDVSTTINSYDKKLDGYKNSSAYKLEF